MKSTLTARFANKTRSLLPPQRSCRVGGPGLLPVLTRRLFLLTLVSFVAVAALLGIAASANKANRAAKARAEQAANAKSAISPSVQNGKEPLAPAAAVIVATLTDNITAATKVAPGANINYTATITNNGAVSPADDATNLNYSGPLDANTTLVPGSVHASPIAFNDTYNWVGNTQLDTVARALPAVTANDVAVNAPAGTDTFTVTAIAGGATVLGGTVTLASPSGSFVYTPPVGRPNIGDGATAQDSFTYTITSSADPTLTSLGTVRINLTGRVWYLVAGGVGDGRSNTPSGSPSAMSTAADKSTDFFYIFSNAGNLNGAFSVDAGQQLLGQGVNLVVSAITLFTAAAPTPTVTNTGAGNCVTLAGAPGNNTVSGFNIGNCTQFAIQGANVGTLAVSTMSINTTGGGLDLTGSGNPAVSVVLGGLTSTGGTKNVNLVNLGGTVTLAGGALSGASNNAFDVSGGVATISYTGTVTNTAAARLVNVASMTGGSVSLSGALSGTGSSTGINLTNNNAGTTLNFTGGITLSTGANAAFTATGGGTVNATQNNTTIVNTVTTTTGSGVIITDTNIGGSGVTFRSVNTVGAPNGIHLSNTGNVAGNNFTITGNGGTCSTGSTCTGGRIQNSTGANGATSGIGIRLNNTRNISLTRMRIDGSQNFGIYGNTVTGVTFANLTLDGTNGNSNGDREGSAAFDNLFGTNTITASSFTGSLTSGLRVSNTAATALNGLTITGSTFSDTNLSGVGEDGIQIEGLAGTNMTVVVGGALVGDGNTFNLNEGDHFNVTPQSDAIMNITFRNNTLTGDGTAGSPTTLGGGVTLNCGLDCTGTMTFNVSNNTISGTTAGSAININRGGSGLFSGTINANTIGLAGVPFSGCAQACSGVNLISQHLDGELVVNVTNNTIRRVTTSGIRALIRDTTLDGPGVGTANTSLQLTATGNNISEPQENLPISSTGRAINVEVVSSTDEVNVCADIGGAGALANTIGGTWNGGGGTNIRVLTRQNPTGVFRLPGYGGTIYDEAAVAAYLSARNNATSATGDVNPNSTGPGFTGGAACTLPSIPSPADDTVHNVGSTDVSTNVIARVASPITTSVAKAPASEIAAKQAALPVRKSLAVGKATPKASASEVARIYRSERPISHHAVFRNKNGFSQDPNAPTSGETVTLNTIATFPAAGKSITIKYSATVNAPPLARQVSTQGTVTANGGINVLTDDPEPGGAADPTVTQVDVLMTWNGVTNTDWNTATNWTPPAGGTQYAPGVSNPAINDVVIPNVGNQPNISATDIGIFSLNISNGRTLTITNPRVLTIGGSPGGDLTLDGIISGGVLRMGTGTHVINNAGGTGSLSATNIAEVLSGSTVTLNNNLQAGFLQINTGGSMNITNRTLSLNGAELVVQGGATLTTTGSTVIFNGTAAQNAPGIPYNNLTINNTAAGAPNALGVTLTGNATVNGTLALTSNDLNTSTFTLTQPNTTASTGVSDVVGTITRTGGPFGAGVLLTFGNPSNQISFSAAGTKPTSVTVTMAKTAPATYAAAVQRNFNISQTGGSGFTAIVRLHYLDTEVTGFNSEATLNLRRLRTSDSHWVAQLPTTNDTTNNWVESNAVLAADLTTQWTFSSLAPTASDGVVTGRIVDDHGVPVEGAVVTLQGTQNRKFITDANGFYRFDNVETSGFYTVTPSRVNYIFNPSVRSFSLVGETTEAAFGATRTDGTANPLDTPEYFVRQHYVDFLGREPDESGFNFWSDQIIGCGNDNQCIERKRENVSAAYFLSIEFQRTGGLVDGVHRASFGTQPQFAQFMPDTRAVGFGVQVGKEGWEALLQANKEAFVTTFVNRPAFRAVYDGMENSAFVDTLIGHTGVSFTSGERDALVSGLANGTQTRADVLRSIAENGRFVNAKFNEAFVMMEYFGYLRRDADPGGFAFWLNKLNQFDGNFERAEMVRAFIISGEFRDRFPR